MRWRTNPGWARCLQGQTGVIVNLEVLGCHIIKQIIFDNGLREFIQMAVLKVLL